MWAKIALLIALVALSSIGYMKSGYLPKSDVGSGPGFDSEVAALEKRQSVPDVSLIEADGKAHHLSEYKGSVVILSFWASWCTPCLVELPTFSEVEKKYRDRGLKVLTVNVDDGNEGKAFAQDFWTKKQFDFPRFFDTSKELSQKFAVEILPANFVLDRQGRLAFSAMGANDWSNSQTSDLIDGLLQEK